MKDLIHTTARAGLAGLGLLALTLAPAAQDEGPPDEGKEPDESVLPDNPFLPPPENDLQAEMRRLFHQVERKLQEIDVRLADAGAGGVPLGEVPDSGLDDLLREAGQGGEQVVSDIDRILEIARELGRQTGMGGQSGGQPPDAQPSDRPDPGAPRDRERTEEAPPEGEKPAGRKEEPGAAKDGNQPDRPRGSEEPGENRPGTPPEGVPENPSARADDADRWGDLPPRAQEIFRNQGRDDMPVQYRHWIDNYYRRLNAPRRRLSSGR